MRVIHRVGEQDESLSQLLHSRGIGQNNSPYRLYGDGGWLEIMKSLNNHIADLSNLRPGQRLVLALPRELVTDDANAIRVKAETETQAYELWWFLYTVQPGDTVSQVLHRVGVGQEDVPFRLFGKGHFLERVLALNSQLVDDPRHLKPGQKILVEAPVPYDRKKDGSAEAAATAVAESSTMGPPAPAEVPAGPPKPTAQELAQKDVETIVRLPEEDIAKIPPKILGEKLTRESMAAMTPEEAEKVPENVKEEKAWDLSLFDAMSSDVTGFFGTLDTQTASAYFGLRFGAPVVSQSDSIADSLRLFSLLTEVRGSALSGLRFYYDLIPEATKTVDGESHALGWQRILLGWGFSWGPFGPLDKVHVTPKIGRYSLTGRLPVELEGIAEPVMQDLSVDGGASGGLEVDVEKTAFFYIARLWAAHDLSNMGRSLGQQSVTSTRAGFDLFLKGPRTDIFGRRSSLHYLLFGAYESIDLEGERASGQPVTVSLLIPFAGLGLSLAI